jgi:hypothetical protein
MSTFDKGFATSIGMQKLKNANYDSLLSSDIVLFRLFISFLVHDFSAAFLISLNLFFVQVLQPAMKRSSVYCNCENGKSDKKESQ